MKQTSLETFDNHLSTGLPVNDLFEDAEPVILRADAIKNDIGLFTGKPCKICKTNIRINGKSTLWSNNGNHDGECYCCYQTNGKMRDDESREFLRSNLKEKIKLKELIALRDLLTNQTGEKHHIHHIIPRYLRDQFADPELNESFTNKVVVSTTEHKEIHNLIRSGDEPYTALYKTVTKVSERIVN